MYICKRRRVEWKESDRCWPDGSGGRRGGSGGKAWAVWLRINRGGGQVSAPVSGCRSTLPSWNELPRSDYGGNFSFSIQFYHCIYFIILLLLFFIVFIVFLNFISLRDFSF